MLHPPILHSRYYILIVACVVWQKSELLKKACLAAALIFPAVAAIHGIVLAALHRDGKSPILMCASQLTKSSRCCRYGCVWSLPIMRYRHLGRSGNRQAIFDLLQRSRKELHLHMDYSYTYR
jgi:hypothetical protein